MVKTTAILGNIKSDTKIRIACLLFKNREGMSVSDIVSATRKKRTNISKQINEMKRSGLLASWKDGKYSCYTISPKLHKRQEIMIQEIINAYHVVDEHKIKFKIYKQGSIDE